MSKQFNHNIWLFLIGIITGILLSGFAAVSFAKDGCGPSTPPAQPPSTPPISPPDDTVDISTYIDGIILHPTGYAKTAILQSGFYPWIGVLLEKFKQPYAIHDDSLPEDVVRDHPVLIIPSGGFFGLEGSSIFKGKLDAYVKNGGTIICFTQERGYEFSALPGGSSIMGYGWAEDLACWRGGAYIDNYHPIFSSQDSSAIDINVDGYFTQWPDNATILLRRSKNQMPTMIMYPYGKGRVIASTIYSDWGLINNQIAEDELNLIRDLIVWAENPTENIPELPPGSSTTISIPICNDSNTIAHKVKITVFDPDRNSPVVYTPSLTTPLSPNEMTTAGINYTAASKLGIYSINYTLQDINGNPVQSELKAGKVSVSQHLAQTNPLPDISFSVTFP
ncbi:MAG: hypothetical protein AAB110_09650, partial [Candidatus Desantisbacteria bacterium]